MLDLFVRADDEVKMSKKKRKLQNQMKIGELKQVCQKPEVVEVWDVTAADPRTLVFLKVDLLFQGCL